MEPAPEVALVWSSSFVSILDRHPSHGQRNRLLTELASAYGLFSCLDNGCERAVPRIKLIHPQPATQADLLSYHTQEYIEFLDKCEVRENEAKRISPVSKRPYLQNKPPSLQEKTIECGDPSYPNLDSSSNIDISDGKEQNITNGHTDQLSLVSIETDNASRSHKRGYEEAFSEFLECPFPVHDSVPTATLAQFGLLESFISCFLVCHVSLPTG